MSVKYGDAEETLSGTPDAEKCDSIRRLSSDSWEEFPFNSGFRGFEKIPQVIIERMDITPYLKMDKPRVLNGNSSKVAADPKLFSNCLVRLLNDDLQKLRADILDHKYRISPFISCRICKKPYSDEKKLKTHQETKHMIVYEPKPQKRVSFSDNVIVHELKEYHKCRKCTKIFEHYLLLKQHMRKDHKKRNQYVCNYCSKTFVDRSIFKVHIKLHCDMCGVLQPNKATFVEHRRTVCKVTKRHKCKVCKITFFSFMDVKDHSYDHLGTYFVCDICKESFNRKCKVSHHIACLHTKKPRKDLFTQDTEDNLFSCNFCECTSVDKKALESHVANLPDLSNKTITGYKDYYFCDQCLEKFEVETDMLQHKWTHFLKQETIRNALKENAENINSSTDIIEIDQSDDEEVENKTFNANDKVPEHMLPKIVLERVDAKSRCKDSSKRKDDSSISVNYVNIDDSENGQYIGVILHPSNKPIVSNRRTLLSKHKCEHCHKYFSSSYCLRRHVKIVHGVGTEGNVECPVCEETFVWPSLLKKHKCIRTHNPDLPFDDARPEVYFENLNGSENYEYINYGADSEYVDFEMPAPIVELTEYENAYVPTDYMAPIDNAPEVTAKDRCYKIVMQEVPIEF